MYLYFIGFSSPKERKRLAYYNLGGTGVSAIYANDIGTSLERGEVDSNIAILHTLHLYTTATEVEETNNTIALFAGNNETVGSRIGINAEVSNRSILYAAEIAILVEIIADVLENIVVVYAIEMLGMVGILVVVDLGVLVFGGVRNIGVGKETALELIFSTLTLAQASILFREDSYVTVGIVSVILATVELPEIEVVGN